MTRKIVAALLFASAPLVAVHAQSMPLPQFLTKAASLEKRGALALFSSDIGILKKEVTASAQSLRSERLEAQRAGRKAAFCPPEKGVSLNSKELLAHFRAIPAAERQRMQVRDALRSFMAKRYPCPA